MLFMVGRVRLISLHPHSRKQQHWSPILWLCLVVSKKWFDLVITHLRWLLRNRRKDETTSWWHVIQVSYLSYGHTLANSTQSLKRDSTSGAHRASGPLSQGRIAVWPGWSWEFWCWTIWGSRPCLIMLHSHSEECALTDSLPTECKWRASSSQIMGLKK